jgi:hypothetical protein
MASVSVSPASVRLKTWPGTNDGSLAELSETVAVGTYVHGGVYVSVGTASIDTDDDSRSLDMEDELAVARESAMVEDNMSMLDGDDEDGAAGAVVGSANGALATPPDEDD